jgi:hypothetical protein
MAEEHSNGRGPNGLYPYAPSKPGAIIFAALFGLSALIHLFQMIKGRAWFYTAFVLGSISNFPLCHTIHVPTNIAQ